MFVGLPRVHTWRSTGEHQNLVTFCIFHSIFFLFLSVLVHHHHLVGFVASFIAVRSPDFFPILFCPGSVPPEGSSHSLPFLCCQSKMSWGFPILFFLGVSILVLLWVIALLPFL
jgi:hypothetical protein